MIIGIGTDLIENSRIKKIVAQYKCKLARRILSTKEYSLYLESENPINFIAKRFAAKEAFVKALGTGFNGSFNFKDMSISNDENGKPYINVSGSLSIILKTKKISDIHISLSDEKNYSLAFVILTANRV